MNKHFTGAASSALLRCALSSCAAVMVVTVPFIQRISGAVEVAPAPSALGPTTDTPSKLTDELGDSLPSHALLRLGTARFHAPSTIAEMALAPNEETVATVGDQLIVWDTKTGKERWRANTRDFGRIPAAAYGVRAVVYSPDSRRLYTPGRPKEVIVWDVSSGGHEVLPIGKSAAANLENQLEAMQFEHASKAIDIAPNGGKLAVGAADGIIVCDDKGQILFEIGSKPALPNEPDRMNRDRLLFGGPYSYSRFSPDGNTLAVVTSDAPKVVRLVDSQTGQELRRITLKARLVRLAFSPKGKQLATTERDSAIRLYEIDTGKEQWSCVLPLNNPYENYTSAIAFSADGKLLAVGATDNRIHLVDAATGHEVAALTGHDWYPWAVAFTADSKMLYSSGWDGAVRRWDLAAHTQLPLPKGVHATGVAAASTDGRLLAYEDDSGSIRLVNAKAGKELDRLEKPGTEYSQLVFAPDGHQLAGGGTSGGNVHVTIWDLPSRKITHRWEWPKGRDPHSTVESICFTPKGDRIAAAVFRQSSAYIWDLKSDQQIAKLKHSEIYGLAFSPDGKTLATAGWDSIVRFWETESGKSQSKLDVKAGREDKGDTRMYTVCYAPLGGLIATAHLDGKVRIWDADDMTLQREFQVNGRFIYGAMHFSPDGLWLATGAMDGSVALWDPLTAKEVWDSGRHQGYLYTVSFGRDSRTLLTGGDDGICYLWDLRPPNKQPGGDLENYWNALTTDDSEAVYLAMSQLSVTPERTVAFLADKLHSVETVVDPDRISAGSTEQETNRLKRLKKVLLNKDAKTKSLAAVMRALSLLAEIGTPQAIQVLEELANRNPKDDVSRLAAATLARTSSMDSR
jgi:WD40 repeat protein